MMRMIAIADIHGCSMAWDTLLSLIQPQPDDLMITLGDYVDRGPDSHGVLERLITLHQTGRLVALRGNHEILMLEARNSPQQFDAWCKFGGYETLASYPTRQTTKDLENIPPHHWEFLEKTCVNYWETENHIFVHGNVNPQLPLNQQSTQQLLTTKFYSAKPHISGKTMICGHTRQTNGKPLNLGYAICIDTWVYGKGWLTGLDVNTGQIWQANQLGQSRTAWIAQFKPSDSPLKVCSQLHN
ncbi:MAG: metallophosphoesterase family protein [Planktothrix sp.]|uniref:metallophosphoesterase family protein n=1 Tax=Planktothrix sp. TaxID=3088171 RepID=UPI0038D37ECA